MASKRTRLTEAEVLERIRQARESGADELDFDKSDITAIPAEIGTLTKLTKLFLSRTQITKLPSEIGHPTIDKELHRDAYQPDAGLCLSTLP